MHFTLNKTEYINHISSSFNDKTKLLEAVRLDCHRMTISINGVVYDNYLDLLEALDKKYKPYMDIICLFCNQNAHHLYYEKVHNILSKKNIILVSNSDNTDRNSLSTNITILPIIKQISLKNTYQAITINSDHVEVLKTIIITIIVDLVLLDDIIVRIDYI
jgi:hypothetical protein